MNSAGRMKGSWDIQVAGRFERCPLEGHITVHLSQANNHERARLIANFH